MPSIKSNWGLPTIHDTLITRQAYKTVATPSNLTTRYAENNFSRIFTNYHNDRNIDIVKLDHVCSAIRLKLFIKHELQMNGITYDEYRVAAGDRLNPEARDIVNTSTVFINEGDFLDFQSNLTDELICGGDYYDYAVCTLEQFEMGVFKILNNREDTRLTYSQLNSVYQ